MIFQQWGKGYKNLSNFQGSLFLYAEYDAAQRRTETSL